MKGMSQSRAQRRAYEKFLKKTDPTKYAEYKSGVVERGEKLNNAMAAAVSETEEAYYEDKQTKIIQAMKADGKTSEEIDAYIEDWVKTIKVWGSSEKPLKLAEIKKAQKA